MPNKAYSLLHTIPDKFEAGLGFLPETPRIEFPRPRELKFFRWACTLGDVHFVFHFMYKAKQYVSIV